MRQGVDSDIVVQRAIEWMVQLHSGEMTEGERAAYERWRAESFQHEIACQQIEKTLGNIHGLPLTPSLRRTLDKPGNRRQFLLSALSFGAFAATSAWFYDRTTPLSGMFADVHTSTGERVTRYLNDGSRLTLNARSSVDLNFTSASRDITLIKGMIYIETQPALVPLRVLTKDGQLTLDAGSVIVAANPQHTRIVSLAGASHLLNRERMRGELTPGQGVRMNGVGFSSLRIAAEAEKSWLNGFFEINDQPLSVLIDALRNYRTGILRVSPAAASLRVSGIFPLDDTDSALESLAQTLPLVVTRTTDYWVSISRA